MNRTPKLLLDYVSKVRAYTRAEAVVLLAHMEPAESQPVLLVSSDAGAPPELRTEADAWQLIRKTDTENVPDVALIPSENDAWVLVRVALNGILAAPHSSARADNERRRDPDIVTAPESDGTLWFGLHRAENLQAFMNTMDTTAPKHSMLEEVVSLAAHFAWSVYQLTGSIQDPISKLPGRMQLQVFFKRVLAAAAHKGQAVSLLLVNPDDFGMINHRYGRTHGDLAVGEIAQQLSQSVRQTDGLFHYGGAVFALVLTATDFEQCQVAADKIRQNLVARRYIDDAEHLTYSIGGVTAQPQEIQAGTTEVADMLNQADVALNRAKLSGGGSVVIHRLDDDVADEAGANPLAGVFTTDTEKDYRNMLLLWEIVALISAHAEPESMAASMIDRLATGFQPDRLVMFGYDGIGAPEVMATNVRDPQNGRLAGQAVELDPRQIELVMTSLESQQSERLVDDPLDRAPFTAFVVPLLARERAIGCLYMDGRGKRLSLDASDVIFLKALAGQMAVALDRAQLAAGWIRERDRESQQLRAQLSELRKTVKEDELIYDSEEMQVLMDTLRRIAPSQATVLISGESGTGKEKLAQAIHANSERAKAQFIVFDCGAVAHTLLEAELFGHIKGAFTGAESASEGRIAQADGGTLFLDEIGELPLHVQTKLLRFVQEKEYAPVGSAVSRKVDVRIVAATNRRLQDEVAAGNFRADLYYRLQVISLQAIPLRHRRRDILPLANHFMAQFSEQNGMAVKELSLPAQERLLTHPWPGNVRELQNAMMRAVLTAPDRLIDLDDIELLPESSAVVAEVLGDASPVAPEQGSHGSENGVQDALLAEVDPWQPLRNELQQQIQSALQQNKSRPVPLGRWLTEDLVLVASDATDNVSRQAAKLVGVPESTFRRHYEKASAELQAGLKTRTESWTRVRPLLEHIVKLSKTRKLRNHDDLIGAARDVLLKDVQAQSVDKLSTGAALMGVTPPTYRRWIRQQVDE